jgi:hypothetical protein
MVGPVSVNSALHSNEYVSESMCNTQLTLSSSLHKFSSLPSELREKIWLASRSQRLITVFPCLIGNPPLYHLDKDRKFWLLGIKARVCTISQVCLESRRVVLSRCTTLGCGGSVTFRASKLRREAYFHRRPGFKDWYSAIRWHQTSERKRPQRQSLPICPVYIDHHLDTLAINWSFDATLEDITRALGIKGPEIRSLAISLEYLERSLHQEFFSAVRQLPNLQKLIFVGQHRQSDLQQYAYEDRVRVDIKILDLNLPHRKQQLGAMRINCILNDIADGWAELETGPVQEEAGKLLSPGPQIFLAEYIYRYSKSNQWKDWDIVCPWSRGGRGDNRVGGDDERAWMERFLRESEQRWVEAL